MVAHFVRLSCILLFDDQVCSSVKTSDQLDYTLAARMLMMVISSNYLKCWMSMLISLTVAPLINHQEDNWTYISSLGNPCMNGPIR